MSSSIIGKPFIHPAVDYLFIGAAWSIVATAILLARPQWVGGMSMEALAVLILLVNSAHFAASTVRLYSDPQNFTKFPFVTMLLPLFTIAVLAVCIVAPVALGRHLQALYLTWSPYHYAAQTYGLVVMYCFRSGLQLTPTEKRLIWWVCMLPFFRAFLGAPSSGLGWFVSREALVDYPGLVLILRYVTNALLALTFAAPIALVAQVYRTKKQFIPLIGVTMMVANALWWTALDFLNAFVLATIAHGLQYLAIVLVFHVQARLRDPANTHTWTYHAAKYYGICLLLGYALFYSWPYAFVWAGAGLAESMLLVTAMINVHHFIVDRYIWRAPTAAAPRR
jgi:hypothetical protein